MTNLNTKSKEEFIRGCLSREQFDYVRQTDMYYDYLSGKKPIEALLSVVKDQAI